MTSKTEIWKSHPYIPGIEVSTLGNVRTLDRLESSEERTQFTKGRVLKQADTGHGYMQVDVKVNDKFISKNVHRLVAQTYIPNPDNLPQVNHMDCDPTNNTVSNLEWCTAKYNNQYRQKHGISNTETLGLSLFAIKLDTLEVLHFRAQQEASRELGVSQGNINSVIKGRYKYAGGYYFKADDGNGIEIDKDKLNDIVADMNFTGGIFAVNLNTSEVSRFKSQTEAGRALGISKQNIGKVIKGKRNTAGGFWFVKDDGHAVDVVKSKLHDIGGIGLKIKQGR